MDTPRIYAENVSKGFLPATGTLHHYRPVPVSPTVRVETGVKEGDIVSMHYDPMIAKLVVWGENRNAALIKLKDCLLNFQVASLPTNINFLLELSNHWAFEMGQVETHFIEKFKTELFPRENHESTALAKLGASLVGACICENDHTTSKENVQGGNKLLSLWYTNPPFRMHHSAKRIMELECDKELHGSIQETLKLAITHQPDGSYFITIEDNDTPGLAIKVMQLGKCDYRVDIYGKQTNITLASYFKDNSKHFHLWHGKHHHHFRQTPRVEVSNDVLLQHKSSFPTTSHPQGSVLAPMAGLVVKVLVENGTLVEEGQVILVLEAMKMEHVVRAPCSGYVDRLKVAAGQQVFDTSVLFIIKDK